LLVALLMFIASVSNDKVVSIRRFPLIVLMIVRRYRVKQCRGCATGLMRVGCLVVVTTVYEGLRELLRT
jgi:hypothetical protein